MITAAFIEARGLGKVFTRSGREVHALRDVDLSISRGDFVAVTGPSGSGKSTLLHILGTLERQSTGSCRLWGRDVGDLNDDERSRLRAESIGFVFQGFHLIPQLDILENVALPLAYAGLPRHAGHERAGAALESVGLGHRIAHRPSELSGGEVQRAAIARAIVANPEVIFADEPTGNLDSATGREIIGLLERLHDAGTAVVMVTHDEAIARRAPRRVALRDGRNAG